MSLIIFCLIETSLHSQSRGNKTLIFWSDDKTLILKTKNVPTKRQKYIYQFISVYHKPETTDMLKPL